MDMRDKGPMLHDDDDDDRGDDGVDDDCINNSGVKWHRGAINRLVSDNTIVCHGNVSARLLHSRWQAPTRRLLELLHHPRPTAAEALDIVVLVNVLRECHHPLTDLVFHVVQAASRCDIILSEQILHPRTDALEWQTLLQLARLRCAMSPTYALRPWCESSCVYTRMKHPLLVRSPRPRSEHAA